MAPGRVAGHDIIVTAGTDQTVRVWGLTDCSIMATLDMLAVGRAVAVASTGAIFAAGDRAICRFDMCS